MNLPQCYAICTLPLVLCVTDGFGRADWSEEWPKCYRPSEYSYKQRWFGHTMGKSYHIHWTSVSRSIRINSAIEVVVHILFLIYRHPNISYRDARQMCWNQLIMVQWRIQSVGYYEWTDSVMLVFILTFFFFLKWKFQFIGNFFKNGYMPVYLGKNHFFWVWDLEADIV
jgi:hypothetical protein